MNSISANPISLPISINMTYTPPVEFNKAISIGNYNNQVYPITQSYPIKYDRPLTYYKSR
jgi:hypothetical protein